MKPRGLLYQPDLLTEADERDLLAVIDGLDFEEVVLRGRTARRTVAQFGYQYDYTSWGINPTRPLPASLQDVRARAAKVAGIAPEALAQTLVIHYPPGAGIGWHRDAAAFGPTVVGVSLGAPARMRFERMSPEGERQVYEQPLAPRSVYVLGGPARTNWKHSVPPGKAQRYSLTFRTVA